MWVRSLVDCDLAECGGKASGLACLIAAGLPVPDGFVVETAAFRHVVGHHLGPLAEAGHRLEQAAQRITEGELPGELVREVETRAAALGTLAVRSSAALEDRATGAAAGVFSSVVGVPPSEVWPAIRSVWTSALTSLAAAYGKQHPPELAVIVQRYIAGERVTVYTRPPAAPAGEQVWVQRDDRLDKRARSADDPIVALALRAEHAIDARDGADVELVVDGEAVWIVQARPIVHPVVHARRPPPPAVLAPLVEDGRTWTWDVAHNPDPLSPAQIGLVERVERAGIAPWSLRVCAGYLYVAPRRSTPSSLRLHPRSTFRSRPRSTATSRSIGSGPPSSCRSSVRPGASYRPTSCSAHDPRRWS
jgi:pyruvate,water dikinase